MKQNSNTPRSAKRPYCDVGRPDASAVQRVLATRHLRPLLFILTMFLALAANAAAVPCGQWFILGGGAVSTASSSNMASTISRANVPHVAYTDNTGALIVKKLTGSSWTQIGSSIANGVSDVGIAVTSLGVPYVCYRTGTNLVVMSYNGTSWSNAGITISGVTYPSIAAGEDDKIWLSYINSGGSYMTVKRYNGSSWSNLTTTAGGSSMLQVYSPMVVKNNTACLTFAYYEFDIPANVTVCEKITSTGAIQYLDVVSWYNVNSTSVALDNNGTPYVCVHSPSSGSAIVYKNNGSYSWSQQGGYLSTSGIMNILGEKYSITIDKANKPYILAVASDATVSVKKLDNGSWITAGDASAIPSTITAGILNTDTLGNVYETYMSGGQIYMARLFPSNTITSSAGSNGSISPSGATAVCYDASKVYSITPSAGFTIQSVTVDGANVGAVSAYTFPAVSAAHTISATFQPCPSVTIGTSGGTTLFQGNSATLTATGATTYSWSPITGLSANTGSSVTAFPMTTTTYTATGTVGACSYTGTVTVSVNPVTTCGSWATVGGVGITTGNAPSPSLSIDASGQLYLAYQDDGPSVIKYNGSTWSYLGPENFSAGDADDVTSALSPSGMIYVAYVDAANDDKATVMRYNGSGWEAVGSAGFTDVPTDNTSIAIDKNGTPYIAFEDEEWGSLVSVMKYNGTNWVYVGSPRFSPTGATFTTMAIDANGTPYVAFQGGLISDPWKASVMKYDGSNWVLVGSAAFTTGYTQYITLAFDANSTPYVSYQDGSNGYKLGVMKFNGTSWQTVGSGWASSGQASNPNLAIDGAGTPYVAYADATIGGKAVVRKFDGTNWQTVGTAGFSIGSISTSSLAIDKFGVPVLAYRDFSAEANRKATVQRLLSVCPITGSSNVCIGATTTLTSNTAGGTWFSNNMSVAAVGTSGIVTGQSFGTATITYTALGQSVTTVVTVSNLPDVVASGSATIYQGGATTLTASGATTYTWSPAIGLSANTGNSVTASPSTTRAYTVTGTTNGCSRTASVTVSVTPVTTCGGAWSYVGAQGFTPDYSSDHKIALDPSGSLYIAYGDASNNWKATVRKFDGSSWNAVGTPGFTTNNAAEISMKINSSGVPYVVYMDGTDYKTNVKKFDGTTWVNVGTTGISEGDSYYNFLALDNNGTPYVGYNDAAHDYKETVQKFNGTAWETVGGTGCTAGNAGYGTLAFDNANTPYLAYQDGTAGSKASVLKYTGSGWVQVGTAGFTTGVAAYTNIAIDPTGTPYVAFCDISAAQKASVMKFNGSSWVMVGSAGISTGIVDKVSLLFDASGTPYISFSDFGNSNKATIMKYNGSNWVSVGTGISSGSAAHVNMIADEIGKLYVAYCDIPAGNRSSVQQLPPTPCSITGSGTVCQGATATLSSATLGGTWASNNTGIATVGTSGVVSGVAAGTATISYTALGQTITTIVTVNSAPTLTISGVNSIYQGDSTTLSVSGATSYAWTPATTLSAAAGATVMAHPTVTTTYTVSSTNGASCTGTSTVTVTVTPLTLCESWRDASAALLSVGQAVNIATAMAADGTMYIAYQDLGNSNKTTVMKYSGSSWTLVGTPGFTPGTASNSAIALDNAGTPYITYQDGANSRKASVMRYTGSTWETVGDPGFSTGEPTDMKIDIDAAGTPYVMFKNNEVGGGLVIMKYDGSSWVNVGSALTGNGDASNCLAIDAAGIPYIGYRDYNNGNKATVRKFVGGNWTPVGSSGFSPAMDFLSMTLDASGAPYVAFTNNAAAGTTYAMRYNGTTWEYIGGAISAGIGMHNFMRLDNSGTPYVAYVDGNNSNKITVKKFTGSSWDVVGSAGFTQGQTSAPSMEISSSGIPHVFYSDVPNGSKARVKQFSTGICPISGAGTLCTGSTLSLSSTTAGGTWSSSNESVATVGTTGTVTGAGSGTATITYTAFGQMMTAQVTVKATPASTSATTITPVSCHGGSNGAVVPHVSGATPLTWSWSNSSASTSITNVVAGVYTYSVSNSCGTYTASATVTEPETLVAAKTVTDVDCFGNATGSVSVTATGGTTPYTGTGNFAGLSSGPFSYTVTDNKGCTSNVTGTIAQPALALTASKTVTSVLCYGGSTGSVSVTATGGTSPYTGTGSFTGLSAGPFSYTVTDANGCTATASGTMSQPASALSANASTTSVLCYGGSTGSVSVTATGGTSPYSGVGNFTGRSAGTHTITVTDNNGCMAIATGIVSQPAQLVAAKTVTDIRCNGESNGSVVVTANGGATPYTGTGTFNTLPAGPYSYTVTDNNGCTSSVSGSLTEPATLTASSSTTISASGFNILCNSGTGSILVSATGGTTPYTNDGTHGSLSAGTHSFTVTDAHGCTSTTSATLTQPAAFYINATTDDDTICNGSSVALSATGGAGSFLWNANNGLPISYTSAPVTATPSTNATTATVSYTVNGFNTLGCSSVPDTVSVTVLPLGYFSGPAGVCDQYSTDLDISIPGGTWYTPDTAIITLDQNGIVNGILPGTATVSYTMPNGCTRTRTVGVGRTPDPIIGIATVCPGSGLSVPAGNPGGGVWTSSNSNITITVATNGVATLYGAAAGSAVVTYTTPNGCYSYKSYSIAPLGPITGPTQACAGNTLQLSHGLLGAQWSSNSPSMASVNVNTGLVTGIAAGTAVISYKVNPSCYTTYTITVNTTPTSIVGATSVCTGSGITLTNTTSGGSWISDNTSAATIGSASGIVAGIDVGTTTISYTMPNGCYKKTTLTVNQTPATISGANNVCVSRTSPYTIATTGGTWSVSSSALAINAGTGVASGVAAGAANILYTMPSGCYSSKAVTVSVLPAAIMGTTTVCEGGSATLSSTTSSLIWSSTDEDVATVTTASTTTGTISGMLAGTSTISYTSAAGCTQTVNVTVYAAPGTIDGSTNVCVGSTDTYTNSVTGGTWSSSATSVATVGSSTGIVTGIGAGSFTLTYTMPGNCRAFKTVSVDALPAAISGTLSTCVGGNTTLTSATSGQAWSSTGVAASIDATTGIVTGISAGTALVSYTNTAGCARTATVTVGAGLPAIAGTASICVGGSATLTNATTGGTWASSSSAATIVSTSGLMTGASAGATTITYRTSPTCFTTTSITVLGAPAAITGPATSVCANATLQLANVNTGGTWSSSTPAKATVDATSGLVTGLTVGSTTISYVPAPGCLATYNVTVNASPNALTGTATVCDGLTTTLSTTSTGGSWISSTTDAATVNASGVVTGIAPGTATIMYKFTATGCFAAKDVTVNAVPNSIVGDNAVCAGLLDTFSNTTTGGTWTSAATSVATIGSATGILNGVAAGTTTLSYTLPTGCRATKVFTVNAIPATGITGTASICETGTTTLNCTTAGLVWSSANTAKATIVTNTATSATVTGVSSGTTTISYTNAAGCARTVVVTVGATPQAISGPAVACSGRIDTLTNATPGGTWSSSAPSVATVGSATGYLTGLTGGTATISYSIGSCRKTVVVTVNMQPGSISGPITICGNNTTTLTATNPGGTWASSNTAIAVVASTSTTTGVVTGGTTAGTAYISYSLIPGCARVLIVTVNAALPAITGPDVICVGTSGAMYTSGTGGTWVSSNAAKASIGFNTGSASGVAIGTSTISYKVNANCFTTKDVTVNAAMASITGTTNVCTGATTTLNCSTPGGTWSSSNTTNASVVESSGVVTGEATGTAYITYQVTGTGCFKTASVNVLSAPAPIGGTLTIAIGATTTLNNTVSGGTWSSSASTVASIGSTSGIMNGVAAGNATITYKLTNGCYRTAGATVVTSMARPVNETEMNGASVTTVRIFPNPSQGNITVETPANGLFTIYTLDAKEVARYDVTAPAASVALPYDLAAGMYICRFKGIDGSDTIVRLVYKP